MTSKLDTRKKILDCALTLFSKNGYKLTTIKEIALLANVNEITVFRHFQTKDGLLDEIFKSYSKVSVIYDLLFGHLSGNLSVDLRYICNTLIDLILENHLFIEFCLIEISLNSSLAIEVQTIFTSYINYLTDYLNKISDQGIIPKSNFQLYSQMFLCLVHQFAFSKFDQNNIFSSAPLDRDEFVNTLVDLFVTKLNK